MGIPKNDLTGKIFGQLTVLQYLGDSKWQCKCSCGKIVPVRTSSLNSGKTKSCGCLRGESTKGNVRQSKPKIDLTDKQFGYLTPMYYIKGGKWHCRCKCGKELDVDTRNLNSGHTTSCGCFQKEKASQNTIDMIGFENDGIKVISKAPSDKSGYAHWNCICKKCGRQFISAGSAIRQGVVNSCGCVHSFNEQRITKMFLENNITFSSQYIFSDLKGIRGGALRFDFAVFKNNKLSHLIEYNGLQHYEKPGGLGRGILDFNSK